MIYVAKPENGMVHDTRTFDLCVSLRLREFRLLHLLSEKRWCVPQLVAPWEGIR